MINFLFAFLIPLIYLHRKYLIIITSKSITHFFCRHFTQHVLVALSRYYRASVGTVMNYAKKIVVFITMHMLLEGIIDKESSWNTRFFITSTFISNTRLRQTKTQVRARQHPEAELLRFGNYSLSSSTLSSQCNMSYF